MTTGFSGNFSLHFIVRMKGLEPPRPETSDPKSDAATNYATCALNATKLGFFLVLWVIFCYFNTI